MKLGFVFVFVFLPFFLPVEPGKCPTDWIQIPHLNSCFFSPTYPANWDSAELYCQQVNSNLVTLHSEEEAVIVKEIFARENPSFFNWIGLRYNETIGNFTWSSGEIQSYSRFLDDEPKHTGDCVAWVLDDEIDGWQTISCEYAQFFMCRKKSEGSITTWHFGENGEIRSPNWPKMYSNNEDITYVINTAFGSRVLLHFDIIETEENRDVITVSEDFSIHGRTLTRLSGSYQNKSVMTSRNTVMVSFKSDEDVNLKGYKIIYKAIHPLPLKVYSNSYGLITSNNYPYSPDSFLIQNYQIHCPQHHHVSISIKELSLDKNDRIKIFNGENDNYEKLKILRQNSYGLKDVIKSTQNSVFVAYDTGEQMANNNHWKLEYICLVDGNLGDEILI